jgi:anti-sigma B factor antagonist
MNTRSTIVVKLPEDLSGKEVAVLLRQLKPALKLDQPSVIVDMSRVRRINTEGLDLLLHCMKTVARRDGSLKLAGISPQAETVLELTRMDRVFDMFPSVADAVASVSIEVQQFESLASSVEQQPAAA